MSDEVMDNADDGVELENNDLNERVFSQSELEKIVEQRLMRERKKFEKKIEGVDLDEAKRLLEEKEKAELERQKEKGEFEKILQQVAEKKDAQISQYKQKLHEIQVDGSLLNAASQQNAVSPQQVVSLLKSTTRLSEDGSVEILDKDGSVRYNDSGTPMSVNELMSEFLTANPHFVRASASGVGSKGAAGGSTQKSPSVADMLANWETGGKKAYAELKKSKI